MHILGTNEVPRVLLVFLLVGTQIWNNNGQMNHRGVHQSNGAGSAAPGQVRPQLSQVRPHHGRPQLARVGRSQARAGRSRPHLARARPGRTSRCTRTYQMPRLSSTAPTIPRTSLGWTRNVDSMSVGSKGYDWKHLYRWTHT
jgi:hypothetical protein